MTATFPANQQAAARAAFGLFSPVQGLRIFDRGTPSGHEPRVVEVAPRTWFIQPGMVNIALFETDEGLLMVDAGCAGDGPTCSRRFAASATSRCTRSSTPTATATTRSACGHFSRPASGPGSWRTVTCRRTSSAT